jgi:hypothetical protein
MQRQHGDYQAFERVHLLLLAPIRVTASEKKCRVNCAMTGLVEGKGQTNFSRCERY